MSNTKNSSDINQQWQADSYKKYGIPQFEIATQRLKKWDFKGNENILDIGCGNGAITYFMSKNLVPNGKVLGIDLSKDMIDLAKKEFASEKNLTFQNISATDFNFKNEFDLITSFYCMHWIEDKQKVVDNIYKALKPNGKVLLYFMSTNDTQKSIYSKILRDFIFSKWFFKFFNYKLPFHFDTVEHIKNIVKKSGLKETSIKLIDQEILFGSIKEFENWIGALPLGSHLSQEERTKLSEQIAKKYLKYSSYTNKNEIKCILPTIVVEAVKI